MARERYWPQAVEAEDFDKTLSQLNTTDRRTAHHHRCLDCSHSKAGCCFRRAHAAADDVRAAEPVYSGGLMSNAPSPADTATCCAYLVDKILKGSQPSDLPMEEPT